MTGQACAVMDRAEVKVGGCRLIRFCPGETSPCGTPGVDGGVEREVIVEIVAVVGVPEGLVLWTA